MDEGRGLAGLPDVLRISRQLAKANPTLSAEMARIGVRLEIASAEEKSLPASLRSAQEAAKWLPRRHALDGARGLSNRPPEERIQQWLALPMRRPGAITAVGLDWKTGPWLSSWETALPPDQPRYLNQSRFDGKTWLLTGKEASSDALLDDDDNSSSYHHDNAAELTKDLLACWPNSTAEIAKFTGITLRNLQWFSSERAALDRNARLRLEDVLGIEFDERMSCYVAAGPYVLIAQKTQTIQKIYEDISDGGNACPCEIVPLQGPADPSWRYVLVNAFGKPPTFIMAPRGEKIAERLPDLMINFEGIRAVSETFFGML